MAGPIKFNDEQLITLAQACRPLPKRPAPSTLWRWRTKGVKVNGRTIKLACIRSGAVADYCRRLQYFSAGTDRSRIVTNRRRFGGAI